MGDYILKTVGENETVRDFSTDTLAYFNFQLIKAWLRDEDVKFVYSSPIISLMNDE
jgi:hypothetical protein